MNQPIQNRCRFRTPYVKAIFRRARFCDAHLGPLYVAKCDRLVGPTYGTYASDTTIYGESNIWIKEQPKSRFPNPPIPAFDASTPTLRKKIEANRRNAQLSTGPKSLEGKKTVAGNARKHGLLANNVVILTGDGKVDQAEFDSLLGKLHEYYKPVGVAEDPLVQEIAVSY